MQKRELDSRFRELFGEKAGDIRYFFAPANLNLIGEHTNYNGGHVVCCAVNIGTWGVVRLRKDRVMRFASYWDEKSEITEVSLDEEYKPREDWDWVRFLMTVLDVFKEWGSVFPYGFDLLICRDKPLTRSTLFSRSCIVLVAMLLRELYDLPYLGDIELAVFAQKAENRIAGFDCGVVNAFASVMGRSGCAILLNPEELLYEYIPMHLTDAKIVITNSMVSRIDKPVIFAERRKELDRALRKLKAVTNIEKICDMSCDLFETLKDVIMNEVSTKRVRHVVYENARSIRAANSLRVGNIRRFGQMMNDSHVSLRDNYEVSCPETDFLVEKAWEIPGVIGSRMHGAGFGGCTVSIVIGDAVERFISTIGPVYHERFGIIPEFYVADPDDGVRELTFDE